MHYLAAHVGQAEIASLIAMSQLQVIEAKQVQHRRVKVVDVNRIAGNPPADVVRGAIDLAALCRHQPSKG